MVSLYTYAMFILKMKTTYYSASLTMRLKDGNSVCLMFQLVDLFVKHCSEATNHCDPQRISNSFDKHFDLSTFWQITIKTLKSAGSLANWVVLQGPTAIGWIQTAQSCSPPYVFSCAIIICSNCCWKDLKVKNVDYNLHVIIQSELISICIFSWMYE